MVHSAAIWVYRALELTRAYACVKTPLDVAVGAKFRLVAEQVRVNPPIQDSFAHVRAENLQASVLEIAR